MSNQNLLFFVDDHSCCQQRDYKFNSLIVPSAVVQSAKFSNSSSSTYHRFNGLPSIFLIVFLICQTIFFLPICLAAGTSRKVSSSISCYTCNSHNETDINCHDPFNPAMSNYVESCKVPKQNHIGVFPARFCVKVIGKTVETGESLVIRACSLESMDNQCGKFKFEGNLYMGCILTCDYDGCNGDQSWLLNNHHHAALNILMIMVTLSMNYGL